MSMLDKKSRVIQIVINTCMILFFITIVYLWTNEGAKIEDQSQIQVRALHEVTQENIRTFRVYHETRKSSFSFSPSESLVKEFVLALKDMRSYSFNHDAVKTDLQGESQEWGIEMYATGAGQLFSIYFYVPARSQKNIIVGKIGTRYFQSELLYQWYQTYSHRWLTPEGSPPAPPP